MLRLGITGGIGSGKSTVCRIFSAFGIPVYDSDSRAKELNDSDSRIMAGIRSRYGDGIYLKDSSTGLELLDRKQLARIIFGDERERAFVNSLVHPIVNQDFEAWASRQSAPYIIFESAILFESGFNKTVDKVLTVTAAEDVRIKRVVERDGSTPEAVRRRISSQMKDSDRVLISDFVIINDDSTSLLDQVLLIHNRLA